MLFNSLPFFLFLTAVLVLMRISRHAAQNWILLAAGCFFYGWWDWRFLGLFWFTIIFNWWIGGRIAAGRSKMTSKGWLATGLVVDLGILGLFKYIDFFAQCLRWPLSLLGADPGWPLLNLILPLGISFYTFQVVGYLVDVYRERIRPSESLFEFALFVSFFPQVIAGPIARGADLIPQFRAGTPVNRTDVREGLFLILWGLFKKVVIADTLAIHVARVYSMPTPDAGSVVVGVLAFTFQIYADFSAYSDIAIGCARLMGIKLQPNFAQPFMALGPGEFWQRWHITLSNWLRDYVFFSIGGGSKGKWRTRLNLVITMGLAGLWHGAAMTFVVWGIYQGVMIVLDRMIDEWRRRRFVAREGRTPPKNLPDGTPVLVLRWALTFASIMFGMMIFRANSFGQVAQFAEALSGLHFGAGFLRTLGVVCAFASPLVVHDIFSRLTDDVCWPLKCGRLLAVATILGMVYGIMVLEMASNGQFIYFQF
jgi:D-alanyl-lipoteichoic acid acyltransferase DltB (MBOAT superfamily)